MYNRASDPVLFIMMPGDSLIAYAHFDSLALKGRNELKVWVVSAIYFLIMHVIKQRRRCATVHRNDKSEFVGGNPGCNIEINHLRDFFQGRIRQ